MPQVLEKSKWDEDNYEWVLPFVKKAELDAMFPTITNLYKPLGATMTNSPPSSTKSSPRVSTVVPLPSASAPNRYVTEASPRPNISRSGIAEEEEADPRQRQRRSTKEIVEPESIPSVSLLPASIVPKPPKSRSLKKKKNEKRRNKEKVRQNVIIFMFISMIRITAIIFSVFTYHCSYCT